MKYKSCIALSIMEDLNELIYVSDLETYELKYVNKMLEHQFKLNGDNDWKGKKCYTLLQNKDEPCRFCTNSKLTHDNWYEWSFYNPVIEQYYDIKDKLINIDDKFYRIEIATNVTKRIESEIKLKKELKCSQIINQCIEILYYSEETDNSINELLSIITKYYEGDRGYIFTISKDREYTSNTHEWCENGIIPQIDNLQNVPIEVVQVWLDMYQSQGHFFINSLEDEIEKDSLTYQVLQPQGITSLASVPLKNKSGLIIGFLGIDNPKNYSSENVVISAVSRIIYEFMNKNVMLEKLHLLSYADNLTRLKNRNAYLSLIKELKLKTLGYLGIIFADINGLKVVNDTKGHIAGDEMIVEAANILSSIFNEDVYRLGGDEFVVIQTPISEITFNNQIKLLKNKLEVTKTVSISIGYVWSEKCENLNDKLHDADHLMYIDKERYYKKNNKKRR